MGKVDAFSIDGFECLFYSNDHRPPHLLVRKTGEWEIRVYFLECTEEGLAFDVKWPKSFAGPKSKSRKQILEKILEHKAELLAEWEAKVDY